MKRQCYDKVASLPWPCVESWLAVSVLCLAGFVLLCCLLSSSLSNIGFQLVTVGV